MGIQEFGSGMAGQAFLFSGLALARGQLSASSLVLLGRNG